jgi:8-oxo-dGTP pyrophosphatase MutT (NUDIX family)
MQKFTKIQQEPKPVDAPAVSVYKGQYLEVLGIEGWEVTSEKDMVVALPYFVEHGTVMVRAEYVPPYKLKHPGHTHFLTLMSGGIEPGESPADALRRELAEECGIVLSDRYRPQMLGRYMVSKGSTAQYHIYIVPLERGTYEQKRPTTDGSASEKKSSNVVVRVSHIQNLEPVDLLTAYVLGAFRAQHPVEAA